jgi:hypothetical protein
MKTLHPRTLRKVPKQGLAASPKATIGMNARNAGTAARRARLNFGPESLIPSLLLN